MNLEVVTQRWRGDGLELAYDRAGRGEPLLLIHGTGSRRQVWEPVLERLAREREVIAVDLPGFGESPPLRDAAVTPERFAGALARLLDGLGLDRVHVAGNSLGGGIALVLGATARARSVACLSPIGFWTPKEAEYCRRSILASAALASALRPALPALAATPVGRASLFWQYAGHPGRLPARDAVLSAHALTDAPGLRATMDGYRRWRFVPAGPLPCPVTIAWGQRDRLLPPRQAPRARRVLPGARHLTLTGCGHVPVWDDPEQIARVLLEASATDAVASEPAGAAASA